VVVRRGLCGFQERRLADLALDVHGLLVLYGVVSRGGIAKTCYQKAKTHNFELRLGSTLSLLCVAFTLLLSFGALDKSFAS